MGRNSTWMLEYEVGVEERMWNWKLRYIYYVYFSKIIHIYALDVSSWKSKDTRVYFSPEYFDIDGNMMDYPIQR